MNEERAREIRAACDAAWRGPWFVEAHGIMDETRGRTIVLCGDSDQDDADAEFIAQAREWVPELLDAWEAEQRGREEAEAERNSLLEQRRHLHLDFHAAEARAEEAERERDAAIAVARNTSSRSLELIADAEEERVAAEAERDRLAAALRTYGQHQAACSRVVDGFANVCTCGFLAALLGDDTGGEASDES